MNAALHRPVLPAIVPPRLPWRGALSMLAHRLECQLRAGDVPNAAFEHGVDPCDLEALVELWLDEIRRDAPLQTLAREAVQLEHRVSDLVNAAYGLTLDEVWLMWDTAPPRMPTARPAL